MKTITTLFLTLSILQAQIKGVKIGKQIWMTENLKVYNFNNLDPIPEAKNEYEWQKAGKNHKPAWCFYEYNSDNEKRYGLIYNWYAVNDPRGIAPKGWHIPNDKEWERLFKIAGNGDWDGDKLKSTSGWCKYYNGTNDYGFNAFPGGYTEEDGSVFGIEGIAEWWSSTVSKYDSNYVKVYLVHYRIPTLYKTIEHKSLGFYVRCVKN